jgi:YggT family protein
MGQSYLGNFLEFVINLGFGLYIFLVLLRFVLQLARADFRNPVAQMLLRATNPPLRPMRRLIPGLGGVDMAAVILLLLLQFGQLIIIGLLPGRSVIAPPEIFLLALGLLIDHVVWLYVFSIAIQVIISWVNPSAYHQPLGMLVLQLNEPLLRPLRRIFAPLSGFDITPIIFIVILMAVHFLLAAPLIDLGAAPHFRP